MKLGCMILYHPTITSQTKVSIIRAMFSWESIEIQEEENNTIVLYIWNIKKEQIWQAVSELLSTDIICGYGFGWEKQDAKAAADIILKKSMVMDAETIP